MRKDAPLLAVVERKSRQPFDVDALINKERLMKLDKYMTRTDLIAFRDMLVSVRDQVAALKRQGKSSDEVIAEKPTAAFDEKWGHFVIDPVHFIRLVYAGL
jgi:hypothetical protein